MRREVEGDLKEKEAKGRDRTSDCGLRKMSKTIFFERALLKGKGNLERQRRRRRRRRRKEGRF